MTKFKLLELWLSDVRNAGRDLDFLVIAKATAGKLVYLTSTRPKSSRDGDSTFLLDFFFLFV